MAKNSAMALSSFPAPTLIDDSSLMDWTVIGSGGFGQIYKARHHKWCCDVAIKLLHYDDGTSKSLLREIDMMRKGTSPYVIQVLGVFKGRLTSSGTSTQLGLVMEIMERGSLASLQETLRGTPPWPLVFRLAHQVALGINFLHSLSPALLHLDLKPSNVLLDSSLNAKLTDFGLAQCHHSVTRVSKKDSEEEGGTISYMPPEAFDISYSPTRASDIYSYGILLWSIVTGRKPYANAISSIVRFRIPQGDRPSLDEIRSQAAGLAGLTGLMNLMERCWEAKPNQRPSSHECTTETEELYKMHKHAIVDAVHQVLKKLDEKEEQSVTEQVQRVHITQASVSPRVQAVNVCDVPTGHPPIQEMAGGSTANQRDRARFKDPHSPPPASACDVDHSSTHNKGNVSSVHPIQSSPQLSSTRRSSQDRTEKASQQAFRQNQGHIPSENMDHFAAVSGSNGTFPRNVVKRGAPGFERQFSSPDTFRPPPRGVHIHLSHVNGFQQGNNNIMHINSPVERKRHPTAPSSVNLPLPHPGSRRDKTGGVG